MILVSCTSLIVSSAVKVQEEEFWATVSVNSRVASHEDEIKDSLESDNDLNAPRTQSGSLLHSMYDSAEEFAGRSVVSAFLDELKRRRRVKSLKNSNPAMELYMSPCPSVAR